MKDQKSFLESPLDRREFTAPTVLALLSGVTITISGCGDDGSPTSPSPPRGGDAVGTVSANHGHRSIT